MLTKLINFSSSRILIVIKKENRSLCRSKRLRQTLLYNEKVMHSLTLSIRSVTFAEFREGINNIKHFLLFIVNSTR